MGDRRDPRLVSGDHGLASEPYDELVSCGTIRHGENVAEGDREMLQLLGHSPEPLLHYTRLGSYLRWRSPLDARLRQLAIVRTAAVQGCEYVYLSHCRMSIEDFGCSEADMECALGTGSFRRSSTEADALVLAQQMLRGEKSDQILVDRLTTVIGQQECLDLMHTVGVHAYACSVLNALGAELDDEPWVRRYRSRFGLPNLQERSPRLTDRSFRQRTPVDLSNRRP